MTGSTSVLQEAIREKTLNLDGPLLEDGTMLESLMACQSNVQRNRLILEETRFMGDHLQGKFAHYLPLMMEATVLYNTLRRMTVLHPMYYIPFYKFVDIFASVLKSRDRGKGSLGKRELVCRRWEVYGDRGWDLYVEIAGPEKNERRLG